jgi:hypothetical protein
MPRWPAFVDADRAAADRGFNADLVPEAGRHPGETVLADPGDVSLWRCGHPSTLGLAPSGCSRERWAYACNPGDGRKPD